MEGYRVVTMDYAADKRTSSSPPPAGFNVIARSHAAHEGSGHRLQHRPLRQRNRRRQSVKKYQWEHQATGRSHRLSDGSIILLAEGRLGEPGLRHRPSSYVMSSSFANQTIAQIKLFPNTDRVSVGVYVLPKHLDEWRACGSSSARSSPADRCPGTLHQRAQGRAVQAGALSLLSGPMRCSCDRSAHGPDERGNASTPAATPALFASIAT